jgi:hypothetical protein
MIELSERPAPLDWAGIVLVVIALAITGLAAHRSFGRGL